MTRLSISRCGRHLQRLSSRSIRAWFACLRWPPAGQHTTAPAPSCWPGSRASCSATHRRRPGGGRWPTRPFELARHAGNPRTLAEVLDARLHALWDPAGAEDRLAAGSEIIDLARAAGDDRRERLGLFWRFVALMELGRVAEAESALAAFEQRAAAAGDAEAVIMVTARRAMLAVLRGRFDQASQLAGDVAAEARRVRLADAEAITGTLIWSVAAERGDRAGWETVVTQLLAAAGRQPGHLFEATAARILVLLGRDWRSRAELERLLPFARWPARGPGGWAR